MWHGKGNNGGSWPPAFHFMDRPILTGHFMDMPILTGQFMDRST